MRYLSGLTTNNYFKRVIPLAIFAIFFSGCATVNGVPSGAIFSKIQGPLLIASGNQSEQVGYNKCAVSCSHSIFYIINWGDASVQKAIGADLVAPAVRISHVDFKYTQFLGCGTYKTIVYYYKPGADGSQMDCK